MAYLNVVIDYSETMVGEPSQYVSNAVLRLLADIDKDVYATEIFYNYTLIGFFQGK